jgi:autotransporter passenger strand-loop-strand repeat protein
MQGGAASQTTVSSGGQAIVSSGGVDTRATVSTGGVEIVALGGLASLTAVSSGGVLRVSSGGMTSGAVVVGGGAETVLAGGLARGTTLFGGTEFDYGVARATIVLSGSHERVLNHGVASASIVDSGGIEAVSSGGVAVGAKLSGGTLVISAGGAASGGVSIGAGKLVMSGTMAAGQVVKFAGPTGVLELANLGGFHAKISGLATSGQKIELDGFQFGAGETVSLAQAGTSGTLTVHAGAKSASLVLIGSYATGDFTLKADGHGGTYVSDPPGPAARLVGAAAGLGGRAGAGVAVQVVAAPAAAVTLAGVISR